LGDESLGVILVNYGRVIYSIHTLTFYEVKGKERHMWCLCYSLRLIAGYMLLSGFTNHFVCMCYICAIYVPSYSEVKRVYDVYDVYTHHIMCMMCVISIVCSVS
jgi:hypothetical protein